MVDPSPSEPAGRSAVVLVFARDPSLGRAKSRIARVVGAARAGEIYQELLGEIARTVAGIRHIVTHDGDVDEPPALRAAFPEAESYFRQPDGDLGERMRASVRVAAERGHRAFCLVGSDCPALTPSHINAALAGVEEGADVVLGPARDGGYYLVAIRDPESPVLRAEGWGGSHLLRETLAIAERHGLSCRLLEELGDIDTIEDYERWRRATQNDLRHDGETSQ